MQGEQTNIPISTLELADGQTLRYARTGNGPPLVLLHTIRMQLEYFKELAPLLARSFTVFAVDLPGHGGSSIDREAAYDEPYLRRSIVDFIERLDLRSVTLAGEFDRCGAGPDGCRKPPRPGEGRCCQQHL